MSFAPDFVAVGTMKCGSTTLEKFLRERDNVELVHNRDAIFNQFGEEPEARIRKSIQDIRNAASGLPFDAASSPCIGHFRVDYCLSDEALECIRRAGVQRLIFSYRDPVERLFSHYYHAQRKGYINKGFREWVSAPGSQRARDLSMFGRNYERILKYYDKSDVFLIASSDTNSAEKLSELLRFLGLPDDRISISKKIANAGEMAPRSLRMSYALGKIRKLFPKRSKGHKAIVRVNKALFLKRVRNPMISAEDYAWCAQFFHDDARLFENLTSIKTLKASVE